MAKPVWESYLDADPDHGYQDCDEDRQEAGICQVGDALECPRQSTNPKDNHGNDCPDNSAGSTARDSVEHDGPCQNVRAHGEDDQQ